MPNPDELKQRKKIFLEDAKAIQVKADEDKERDPPGPTDAEVASMRELVDRAKALDGEIAKAEEREKLNLELTEAYDKSRLPTPRRTEPIPPDGTHATEDLAAAVANRVKVGQERLFDDSNGGYGENGFGQFAIDVRKAREDSRAPDNLVTWNNAVRSAAGDGMNTFIGADGGYLIPSAFGELIDRIALESAVVRPRAMRIPMTAQRITFPSVDDTTHAAGVVFGGVQAYFRSEEAQLTSSKVVFGEVALELHKLTALAFVTGETLDWSPLAVDSWLPNKLAQAITWKEEDKFIGGVGASGEPTGLLNAACKIEVSAETDQADTTIVFENIINMSARLWDVSGRNKTIWIANRTVKPQLAKMYITVGTGGMPVFMPANGAVSQPGETLYGYPIIFTEHASALGTAGDLFLVNLGEYMVGDAVSKTRSDRSIHLKFDYDQPAYRVITYVGGISAWRSAFTPQNGDSLSPVVTLAARP